MKLSLLGGASEVGASCTVFEAGGHRILIDAGIRMQARDGDPLPNLQGIQEAGGIEAILVTHAHTDHIGALPLVHLAYPQVPILTTAPTRTLMQILLYDGLKIMQHRWEREQEIPLYPPEAVQSMLSRVQIVPPGEFFPLCRGELKGLWTPSGHVLGACSLMLETPEGRVLFTGDYSLDPQRTVEGMLLPRARPDLVVTESTYGNRMHAHRRSEEERLAQTVAEVVAAQGKVLVPAFAFGRAQEVLLILLDAQRRGAIPRFPIFVDGLVKSICAAYALHPDFLSRSCRRLVERYGNPFFPEDLDARPVLPAEREKLVSGPPCAIVSSSGMLTGGPSQFYAAHLASDPKNAIFITGYQDEESPGRRVLELAEGTGKTIRLGGQEVAVACRVDKYSLSAHADAAQMLGVLSRLGPQDVILVHGDEEARTALAASVPASMRVHLPRNGERLELAYRGRPSARRTVAAVPGIGAPGEAFDPERLRRHLLERALVREGQRFTVRELAETWHGSGLAEEQLEHARQALQEAAGIEADPRRPFLFRVLTDGEALERVALLSKKQRKKQAESARMERNQALSEVERRFPEGSGLYRKGYHQDGTLLLHFEFPAVARERYAAELEELARVTGWKVSLSTAAHQGALAIAAQECLPEGWVPARAPAVHPDGRVKVKLAAGEVTAALIQAAQTRFLERTGHRLEVEAALGTPAAKTAFAAGRMEQNLAFTHVRQAFTGRGLEVYRCSKKEAGTGGCVIEVALVSPQVAERNRELVQQLEAETGWPIRFAAEPNQDAIKRRAKALIPSDWGLKKEPGFFQTGGFVQVKTFRPPSPESLQKVSAQLEKETGFRLVVA